MLRLSGGQVESLFDLGLPVEVRELPADLAVLDGLLADPALLAPVEAAWDQAARGFGRPTIPIERLLRLMVIKQRSGWGYEVLVREVSDSLHLRRFCRIALTERVPDESTVRKLVRRLGPEVIEAITRAVIANARTGDRRFVARAARIDSTVVEADIRYPTDLGLACDATKALAREAAAAGDLVEAQAPRVRDRSRAVAQRLRRVNRTLAARTGQGKPTALRLTGEAGQLVERSVREARRVAERLRARARGRGAQAKLAAARRLEEVADRAGRIARQIRQRLAGERITDRLVSISDPDARPIRKGKLRAPTEFGYVIQLAEVCENTRRGARGLIVPVASEIGSPNEPDLLPATAAELDRLQLRPRELALDGGFYPDGVAVDLPGPERVFISGRQSAGSRRTDRRLARFRVGIEGRISHLKRRYGLRRSRLKGHHGAKTWTAWAILAYNLDTLAIRAT
jgi:IS5 family transposase